MDLEFNWINILILFGALHGLIFVVILLFNKKHPGAKFLAAFMFILSYNGFETFNWSSGLDSFVFDLFSFVWIYGFGPSLYLYVRALLKPDQPLSIRKALIYYSPMIFQFAMKVLILSLYIYVLLNENQDLSSELLTYLFMFYSWYSEPISVVVFLLYLGWSIRLFLNIKNEHIANPSQQIVNTWLKALLICMTVFGLLWPLTLISASFIDVDGDTYYYPIELLLVFFVYWIAFVGYHKIRLINPVKSKIQHIEYSDAEQHLIALKKVMEREKLYLDPELNRNKVARHLGVSAKLVSAVLNQHANQNFNDFVNCYRVAEVIDKLKSGENNHLTISGIAFDSGFNSQATFQRVFKSIKGMSPKEFQNLVLEKTDK
ncbi:MAG: helix-turn-helix domain-containing protein [Bacteroidota bacterium]